MNLPSSYPKPRVEHGRSPFTQHCVRSGARESPSSSALLRPRLANGHSCYETADIEVLNEVVLNQILVAGSLDHVTRVQTDGTCWLGGTNWRGHHALRISLSNWSTTEDDVRRSATAILNAA